MSRYYLSTGQTLCHDTSGSPVPCPASGQDGEFRSGLPWPRPRFRGEGDIVADLLTGLIWSREANAAGFPLTWREALFWVAERNLEAWLGRTGWRLPNRRELRSLISHADRNPALPAGHPFRGVFLGWYWTSTTCAMHPASAWYVHLEGGRMFYGRKDQSFLVWPVAGESPVLPATGQRLCFDGQGRIIDPPGWGLDGELRMGAAWPEPRFEARGGEVLDRLTGLIWTRRASLAPGLVTWRGALDLARELPAPDGGGPWRLPSINELESLVDADRHGPALPAGHPFRDPAEACWSSTTSAFLPDWAMALYLHKGAVGVGMKSGAHFQVWCCREAPGRDQSLSSGPS